MIFKVIEDDMLQIYWKGNFIEYVKLLKIFKENKINYVVLWSSIFLKKKEYDRLVSLCLAPMYE
jgi:hypothetical protein